jgi:SAM-dependent methyltransferase
MKTSPYLYSLTSFGEIILPALALAGARRIVEIGSEYGGFTQKLHAYASQIGGQLISIDPAPKTDALDFIAANRNNPHFQFVQNTSINALPAMAGADAYVIDGDHNYFTVRSELDLISQTRGDESLLIFEHDVCWPCGRRDMYYNPDAIPPESRHSHSFEKGITLDNAGMIKGGLRGGDIGFALHEGGGANGVRTAIEDFLAEHSALGFEVVPVVLGLGIIYSRTAPWADRLVKLLRPFTTSPLLELLERNRLELYLKVIELQDQLAPCAKTKVQSPAIFNQMPPKEK